MQYLGGPLDVVERLALKSLNPRDYFGPDNIIGLLDLAHHIDHEADEPLLLIAQPIVQVHHETSPSRFNYQQFTHSQDHSAH